MDCFIRLGSTRRTASLAPMKPGLWRPEHEADEAFLERCRPVAMPIAYGLLFLLVSLFLWACWTLSALLLT